MCVGRHRKHTGYEHYGAVQKNENPYLSKINDTFQLELA